MRPEEIAAMSGCIARAGHSITVYDNSQERATNTAAEHRCQVAAGFGDVAQADFVVGYARDHTEAIKAWDVNRGA